MNGAHASCVRFASISARIGLHKSMVKMLKETSAVAQKAIDQHQTMEQMKQAKILAPWGKVFGQLRLH